MAKAEKKPKAKKDKPKKEKVKKVKGKKGKAESAPIEDETPAEFAAAESVVPFKKAFSFILGGIAVSVISLGLGIAAGLLLFKPTGDVVSANASASAADSAELSMSAEDEATDTEQEYELRSWGTRYNEPVKSAQTAQTEQAEHVHAPADNANHSAEPPVLKTPVPEELNKHLAGYAGRFEELSRQMAEYTSASDYDALIKLNESAARSADELFDYAKQAAGSSESTAYSAYELSSAFSILAEGIHYAARVLENGELFDTKLVEMTNESARAKVDSAIAGAPAQ